MAENIVHKLTKNAGDFENKIFPLEKESIQVNFIIIPVEEVVFQEQ